MKAFFKTLFGDWLNLGFVALVIVFEAVMIHGGLTLAASIAVPVVIMAGVGWLATR